MADNNPQAGAAKLQNAGPSASAASSAARKRNPAFAAMGEHLLKQWLWAVLKANRRTIPGLPHFRLPSRNWLIFFSIVGAWTAAVTYDRMERKRMRQKWCRLVEGLAKEPLPAHVMDRKLTVVLGAPPADGLMLAREHFHEYVKPVLVSAGLDWDVVEGRREGDIRAGLAERIRKRRKITGEGGTEGEEEVLQDTEVVLEALRQRMGVTSWDGTAGDVVIGRHAWKEYVRGLHEGWLGPVEDPNAKESEKALPESLSEQAKTVPASVTAVSDGSECDPLILQQSDDDASPASNNATETTDPNTQPEESEKKEEPEESKEKLKRKQPPPFLSPAEYSIATLSPTCPPILGPSTPIPYPHILGFFNFPIRIYRFLNKRHLADDIGRQVAAAAIGIYRPYESDPSPTEFSPDAPGEFYPPPTSTLQPDTSSEDQSEAGQSQPQRPLGIPGEQQSILAREESEWHKSVRKRDADAPGMERVWLDDVVLDPRIAARMQRFELTAEDDQRAQRLGEELRRERWRKVWDAPARVARGAGVAFGWEKTEKTPLETVGYWDEDER